MSRVARIVVPGFPHHVTQRGNRRADIFETDDDRYAYLRFLKQYADRHQLAIWAYCLMSNHVHLIVVPTHKDSLGKALHDAHTVYAMRYNTHTELSGHLWQGRFYSCPMDDGHLWDAVRYVERNPIRAGLVARAEDYPWSSAPGHCGKLADPVLSRDFPPPGVIPDWSDWLKNEDDAHISQLRACTRTGKPCGTPTFLTRLETLLDRSLQPKPRGRKPRPIPANSGTDP